MQLLEEYKSDMKKLKTVLERQIDYRTVNAVLAQAQYILKDYPEERKYCFAYSDFVKKMALREYAQTLKPQWDEMYWQAMLWEAKNHNLDSYFIYVEKYRDADRKFYLPRRKKFLEFGITQAMQDLLDDKIDLLTISMPPGSGKLLADDTPILTKNGWKNHGDLKIGDYVISPNGEFVRVINVFPKGEADVLITFTNGEKIQCHENHEWLVYDRASGKEKIIETKELMNRTIETGNPGKRGHRYIFQIPNKSPFIGEEKELPVPAYVLGAWLGDGTNRKPTVTVCNTDLCIAEEIVKNGYLITTCFEQIGCKAISFSGLRNDLHKIGMCNRDFSVPKRIPDIYLTANINQRLDLLAGLLDTDGTIDKKKKRYLFSTTEECLKNDFVSLVSTFGWRCCVTEEEPKLSARGITGRKKVYVIGFNPTFEIPCRVERKKLTEFNKQRRIAIKSIEKSEVKTGNCIQVDGGLYLAGKTLVTTHNSTAGIFLLSGVMGWWPEEPNLASAHSGILTRSFYDGVSQILNPDSEYAWHEIFPGVKFNMRGDLNSKEQTINVGEPKRFKSLTCRAINASLTGATRCEKILYADDLCSGIEEALSKERLDKLWQTYNTDLKTRKKKFCKEIHIQTRWSVHDVVGRLQLDHENDDRARFISVPALNEKEESNFDYDYNVGFDTKYFLDMKQSMDDVSFKCLYMNEPIEREGLLYHDDDFERYYELPDREPDSILGICDTKDRGTDFCFLPIFYQYGDKYYWEDCAYDNGAIEIVDELCASVIIKHNPHNVQFESNSAGGRTADAIYEKIKGKCRTRITKKFTTQNKETKIIVNSGWVKEHVLIKDKSMYTSKSPYGKAVVALMSYTVAGKNPTDDVPDGMGMFAEYVANGTRKPTQIIDSPF